MTKHWISGGAVGLFVSLAALAYWKGSAPKPAPDRTAPPGEELAAVRAEVAELKRNSAASLLLARVASEREPQAAAASAAPTGPDAPAAPPAKSQQEQDEENRRVELARAESLDRKFEAEPVDRAWAPVASQEARKALQAEVSSDTTIGHIDCRATWCRIETVHADVESFKAYASKSLLSRDRKLWNGGIAANIRDESEGAVTAVTFITREGHAMPLPEEEEPSAAADFNAAQAR